MAQANIRAVMPTNICREIRVACAKLADWPNSGRARPEIARGLRSVSVLPHVVFYRVMAPYIVSWREMKLVDTSTLMLRVATTSDASALGRVHVTSWHETYTGILPNEMLAELSIEKRTAAWKRMLDDPPSFDDVRVHISENGGEIVGFGACCRQRTASHEYGGFGAEIGAIYILKSSQGCGIGKALMRTMALDLAARGYRGVSLWVLRENDRARRFYERLGG